MTDSEAIQLVMQLMAISGQSGQEQSIVELICSRLRQAGMPESSFATDSCHHRSPFKGEQGNLAVKLPGTVRRPRRLFSAHTDTVPICVGSQPIRKANRIYAADPATGLGADDRAGVAVLLATAIDLLKHKLPHPPLTFLWTVQEEVGLQGARNLRVGMLGRPQFGFNFDGGSPTKLTIGATGGYRMEIEILGTASHAGNAPEEGVSAIAIASLAISDLVKNGWHGKIVKGQSSGTSNVGVIRGGAATNVVTDRVVIRAEARSHDPKFRERIVAEIDKAFLRAARKVRNHRKQRGEIRLHGHLDYESYRLSPQEPCVTAGVDAVVQEGLEPELAIANGGVDANWLMVHGIPTVSLGCGQKNIHTTGEQLDIKEFLAACRIALRLATDIESR
jgi:tripeptide aminopeptidase